MDNEREYNTKRMIQLSQETVLQYNEISALKQIIGRQKREIEKLRAGKPTQLDFNGYKQVLSALLEGKLLIDDDGSEYLFDTTLGCITYKLKTQESFYISSSIPKNAKEVIGVKDEN